MITPDMLHRFAPACDENAVAPALQAAAERFDISTPLRLAHWLGQCSHESMGFTRRSENLSYSAARLQAVWPHRFPTLAAALPFEHNPAALADKVYGFRADLGNVQPGDGAKFIGRGYIQLTGRFNAKACGDDIGRDLTAEPEWLATVEGAAASAGWYWHHRNLNVLADRDDVEAITRAINGGTVGLTERQVLVARAKAIFG